MRKLDLILENIQDEYMINLLEEGASTELETLKTKKFLKESLSRVRGILIEEGVMDSVKQHLGDNWGKYLASGAAVGLGAHGADVAGLDGQDLGNAAGQIGDAITSGDAGQFGAGVGAAVGAPAGLVAMGAGDLAGQAQDALTPNSEMQQIGDKLIDAAGNIYDAAGQMLGNITTGIGDLANQAQEAMAGEPEQPQQPVPGAPVAPQQ